MLTKSFVQIYRSTAGPIPTAPPSAPPLPPAQPMASIPVAAIRHAQAMETPAHLPPPPPPPAAAGSAPVVRLPPSDPTKEIAGTRSEHRVKLKYWLYIFSSLFLFDFFSRSTHFCFLVTANCKKFSFDVITILV
jgi:hypothetical protein